MKFIAAVAVALSLFFAPAAHASPWAPERGHGYAKIWMKYLLGFGFVNNEGETSDYANYHELFVASYGEVGLGGRFAFWWQSDLVRTFYLRDPVENRRRAHVASGDPAVGASWQFLARERLAMSLSFGVRAPLADAEPVQTVFSRSANDEGEFETLGALQLGEGAWSVSTKLEAGYAFDTWYLAASLGYAIRNRGYDDRLTWSVEAGLNFRPRLRGRIRLSGAHSLPFGTAERVNTPSGLGNGVSWAGASLEGEYEFVDDSFFGVSLEGGLGFLRSQTAGPVVSLYVANQF
ncbi:MAG: hypothetical protein ACI9KE_006031 [Polyangiales bacterium]